MAKKRELGGIEYHGIAGASRACQDAVMRLLQFGDDITQARIVSCSSTHCLLLANSIGDRIAIKSGFSSGYGGTGPTLFSRTLQLVDSHGIEIDECEVEAAVIERLDCSALTTADLENIETAEPILPTRWYDYVMEKHYESASDGTLWRGFRPVVPFGIIDRRIIDLALDFWKDPDANLLSGNRRLEDIVRKRTSLDEHGPKLFSKAFNADSPSLQWGNIDEGEKAGRVQLFTGAYMSHRNPRAHRELKADSGEQLTEFLLLNHLYWLEKKSKRCQACDVALSGG